MNSKSTISGAGSAQVIPDARVTRPDQERFGVEQAPTANGNKQPVLALPRPDVVRGGLATWQLKRAADYIENNLAEPIKVTDVASVTRLSPCHFARAFKRSFGLSVHLFLMRRRIELAQQLLVSTYDPLGEIALICGMHDQPHFTRWFRRLVGETPNRWRHAHRIVYKGQLMEAS